MLGVPRLRRRRARPGPPDAAEALAAAHHLLLGHGLAVAELRARPARPAQVSITLNPGMVRAGDRRRRRRGRRPPGSTGCRTGCGSTRCSAASTPPTSSRDTARVTDWSFVQDGDLAVISRADRRARRQLLQPRTSSTARAAPARRHGAASRAPAATTCASCRRAPAHRDGLAGRRDRPARAARAAAPRLPGMPMLITENGAAYDDEVVRRRRGARPRPGRLPAPAPARGAPRRSPTASTCAATSSGR